MSKTDTITISIVFTFAIFLVAGLAIVPALPDINAEPEMKELKNTKPKNPNYKNGRGGDV